MWSVMHLLELGVAMGSAAGSVLLLGVAVDRMGRGRRRARSSWRRVAPFARHGAHGGPGAGVRGSSPRREPAAPAAVVAGRAGAPGSYSGRHVLVVVA